MPRPKCAWMLFLKPKALSVRKWFHMARSGFRSAAHCDRSLVDSLQYLSVTRPLWLRGRLRKSKLALTCHSHRYKGVHSSKKEKPQNQSLWVQFFSAVFLAVSGTLLFASCQNGATQHHPAGLDMLGLVVWGNAWPATWSKGTKIRVLFFGTSMGFSWQMFLILWEKAPQECFWLGDTQGSSSE